MKLNKIFLLALIILFSGCTIVNINTNNYLKNVDNIIKRKSNKVTGNAIGYQYDLPNGVSKIETNDFNLKLKSGDSTYYLYVDMVSYYYKVKNTYKVDEDAFLSSKLSNNKKTGYVEVNKEKDKYFVEMMYNYAKMESYVDEDHLKETLNNMAYILSSIKYNDDIVVTLIGDEKYNLSSDENYSIFKTKKVNSTNFLKYDKDYNTYSGEQAAEDLIEKKEIEHEDN